ncbi:MAG TPA: hypothetical protein VMR52_10490 [Dehalococcoidia bacterium]|nr:hypothetical protein [Dehalococcoidia bacterium]
MSSLLGRLGIRRQRRRPQIPTIAELVAASTVPVYGLENEVLDLRFKGFTYSSDEVELLFQRPSSLGFGPGVRIGSRRTDGTDPERFVDMLIRSAAQRAALDFSSDQFRMMVRPFFDNRENPFALLDQFPLSGTTEFVQTGDGGQGSVLIWQWKLPAPLRAMALGERNPIIVASYDLSTEHLLHVLESLVPINDRPDLTASFQAAFDERRRAQHEGPPRA